MLSSRQIKEDFKILWYLFGAHKMAAFVVFCTMILASFLESLNLAALHPIINYGLNMESRGQSLQILDGMIRSFGIDNLFLASCLFLVVVTVIAAGMKVWFNYAMYKLIANITSDNQKQIFQKFMQSDYDYFTRNKQGQLIYAGTNAPRGAAMNILCVLRILSNLVTSMFFVTLLLMLAWQGTVGIIMIGGIYIFFIRRLIQNTVKESARKTVEEDERKTVILNEYLSGIKSIKALLANRFWQVKHDSAVERSVDYNFRVMFGRSLPESSLKFMFFTIIAVVGMVFSFKGMGNILPLIPILGTFVAVASRLLPYLNLIGNDIVNVVRYIPESKIVYDILNEKEGSIKEGNALLESFKHNVVFEDIWFKYEGVEEFLLKGISCRFPKNKVTAVVGASGTGKTTMINLLLRFYDPSQGKILLDGKNISDYTLESYLGKIGYVSQEHFIYNDTIEANIRFGDNGYSQEDIEKAAALANAHDFIIKAENGYQTLVGDAGLKLSGGQRQRLTIARTLLRKPEIIVLDEATSALDNVSEKAIQEAIDRISQFTTVVIIAHRLSTVQNADNIIVLDHGRVVEEGTHQNLFDRQEAYYQLYKSS